MLSTQAVFGLLSVSDLGTVPWIITFTSQSPEFLGMQPKPPKCDGFLCFTVASVLLYSAVSTTHSCVQTIQWYKHAVVFGTRCIMVFSNFIFLNFIFQYFKRQIGLPANDTLRHLFPKEHGSEARRLCHVTTKLRIVWDISDPLTQSEPSQIS